MRFDRRVFLASLAATAASASRAAAQARGPAQPVPEEAYFDGLVDDNGFSFRKTNLKQIAARYRRQLVKYIHKEPPGSLVVDTKNHALYVTFENNTALRYGVGVGRPGFTWAGVKTVSLKREWPDWTPPAEMIERQPYLPRFMAGGPGNPMGARALYLGSTVYRIHGTNAPDTIGHAVSSGCFRLVNEQIEDLYDRVKVGTKVVVQQ